MPSPRSLTLALYTHWEIIEALVKHDTERAVEMLQKDILNVKEQIQENYSL